jgi:trans-2,3-dihydro-3-hydroxyanthranilate isomerase
MQRRYVVSDVFTDRPFTGNQLAVVLDGEGLDGTAMQAITREFNFSETTFILPPERGGAKRVRIFTPAREIPFAGHPTIGTALVLAREGMVDLMGDAPTVTLEEGAGAVPVRLRRQNGIFVHAELEVPEAPSFLPAPPAAELAAVLSLEENDLVTDGGLPKGVSVGLPFLIVEIRDRDALGRARLDLSAYDHTLAGTSHGHLYLVTRDGGEAR